MKNLFILFLLVITVTQTSCTADNDTSYPVDPDDRRRLKHGKLTGEGIKLFGGKSKKDKAGYGTGIGVNSALWRATLDTVSFMPLASADPFGGVIITDWYEDPDTVGERFKLNIMILDTQLRSNALRVSVFKQALGENNIWKDIEVSPSVATELEDKILTRARQLYIEQRS